MEDSSLDDVLNGVEPEEVTEDVEAQADTEEVTETDEPTGDTEEVEAQADTEQESLPPSDENTKTVPLSALESERGKRQDWKEKAIRAEAERDALKQMQNAQQNPQEQQEIDPIQQMQHDMVNERFNTSELLIRNKYEDVDDKLAVFDLAVKENPALGHQLQQERHPWEFMYKEASKMQAMNEIGSDPASYRKKIEDEIRAQIAAENNPTSPAQKPSVPQSLAGQRSSASRSSSTYTGPTDLDSILK